MDISRLGAGIGMARLHLPDFRERVGGGARVFMRIKDAKLQRRVVDLVQEIAGEDIERRPCAQRRRGVKPGSDVFTLSPAESNLRLIEPAKARAAPN
jgi:hypothetical protein